MINNYFILTIIYNCIIYYIIKLGILISFLVASSNFHHVKKSYAWGCQVSKENEKRAGRSMEYFLQLAGSPKLILMVILSVAYLVLSNKDTGIVYKLVRAFSVFYIALYSVALVVFVFSLMTG